ncbi:MAG: exodeoxyribonuclease VII large subunit [Candidatus Eremiobacteraeota bacterium]|nr:exodeoxyribonuclease VII large subunit [Candidatus Eremiobacteraeota bacterium]
MKLFEDSAALAPITVSQFSERLRRWLDKRPELQHIAIAGEISGWKPQPSGNVFFSLKDDRAILRCFAYGSDAKRFPRLCDGIAVVATGAIGIWERSSEYQLRVTHVDPVGVGAIAAKVEALRKRLQLEGLFERARKRELLRFPRRVALVSARGKGADDFETTLGEKSPNVAVTFIETRVQGAGAEIDIADAIDRASRESVDAIVLLRGGGSYEDRYPFNTEPVVRAIVRSRHPVVTAIGHTGDRHLADEVADAVFKTPTAAAEYIAGSWAEVTGRMKRQREALARAIEQLVVRAAQRRDSSNQALSVAIETRVSGWRQRLLALEARIERQNPRHRLAARETRLTTAAVKFEAAQERIISKGTNALALAYSCLAAVDPEAPLERGYAIVTSAGRALRDAREVSPGDGIEAQLHRGRLAANVERVMSHE